MPPLTLNQALQQALEHHNHGRFVEAEKLYRLVLEKIPNNPDVLRLLGLLAHQTGNNVEAEKLVRQALAMAPAEPKTLMALANILQAQNRMDDAIALYREVLAVDPQSAEAHHHLGVTLSAAGRFTEAAEAMLQAHRLAPSDSSISGNLGIVLCHLKLFEQGGSHLHAALLREPKNPDFHAALAGALLHLRQNDPALAACKQALALDAHHADAHHVLSQVLTAERLYVQAAAEARIAAELLPTNPDVQLTWGSALEKLGRLDDAAAVYQSALDKFPKHAPLHNNLGNVFKGQAALNDAISHYQKAIAAAPPHEASPFHSNLLFAMIFHPAISPEDLFAEHLKFDTLYAAPLRPATPMLPHEPAPHRRLRIGYLSMQFVSGYHLFSLIANHDKSQFEIFLYSNTPSPDHHTENFRRHADHFSDVRDLTDEQLAALIRRDQIDLLIDLSLHMGGNRLLALARKPAPIQISFFGYPGTTGMSVMDYRITDRFLEPENLPTLATEKSLRLPDTYWCYHPHVELPVNDLPAKQNGGKITFGNLNNFCKINTATLDLWSKVLRATPNSRLIMMTAEGSHRDRTANFFASRGISADHVEFVPFLPPEKYFAVYHRIDIGLDSFPYNGHTTSLDAFFMGVPVLTMIGNTSFSRAGYSQLMNLGLPEFAAATPEAFVQLATTVAGDLSGLSELRRTLRDRMAASPLMDAKGYAVNVERLYREVWQHGTGLPPGAP